MNYYDLIYSALEELRQAADKLIEDDATLIAPPPSRAKKFIFCEGVEWPLKSYIPFNKRNVFIENIGYIKHIWRKVCVREKIYSLFFDTDEIAEGIIKLTRNNPKKLLRALRRIQAATNWCKARLEGRKRATQQILDQRKS